jgi:hypothetical protein
MKPNETAKAVTNEELFEEKWGEHLYELTQRGATNTLLNMEDSGKWLQRNWFLAGITAGEKRIREEVSKGFEEWYSDTYELDVSYDPDNCCGEAWQAAKLSAFRDVEFTNKHYHELQEKVEKLQEELHQQGFNNEQNLSIDQKVADEIDRLTSEIGVYRANQRLLENSTEQLRRDLDLVTRELLSGAGDIYLETISNRIRQRHGLNKEKV